MSVPDFIVAAKGTWKGKSKLHQVWLPPERQVTESDSTLFIDPDPSNTFATVLCDWADEGEPQHGRFLLCGDAKTKAVEIGWVDTWHMSGGVMHLAGAQTGDTELKTRGSYGAGDEVWGWTVDFALEGEKLTLKMDNVTPDGDADWAVDAVYERVAG
ncbi:MAG TPA: DUF1579 family protein [Fimbriimonadaceae bacterium]|nr:DUF1579 family protein [Fimbriimonadaceae bacterium]